MTWLQPWAWLGLGALVVPIVIHLVANAGAFNGFAIMALLVVELVAAVVWFVARRRRERVVSPAPA